MSTKAKSLLKYILALGLLVIILRHAQLDKVKHYLEQMSVWYILLALLVATLSQLAAAFRMQFFFQAAGFPLNSRFAIILFYVGAFYNFLLPGGMGGDAYKVILARQRIDMPAMQGVRIMLADRASGLCILMLNMFLMLYLIGLSVAIPFANPLLALAALITVAAYLLFSQLLFKQPWRRMIASWPYSLGVQLFWVIVIAIIWASAPHSQHLISDLMGYIALYCVASITGQLPVSVGGLGIKEMTYFYGASLLQHYAGLPIDPELGVAISLCQFFIAFVVSLPGLFWLEKVRKMHHL